MEAVLYRTGSGSIPAKLHRVPSSPRLSATIPVPDDKKRRNSIASPRISSSLHLEVSGGGIHRSYSEPDITRSEGSTLIKHRSRSFHELPAVIPEEDFDFPGGGMNNNRSCGGGGFGHDGGDGCEIGVYYENMLKTDPMNSLILRNYGKYLHEVEGNYVKAEECYGRAILASPGDGELLSLYGNLIWETQRDESRAKSYFQQAVEVAPEDCTVLGSYAHFLWEVDDDEEEEEEEELGRSFAVREVVSTTAAAMVEAF